MRLLSALIVCMSGYAMSSCSTVAVKSDEKFQIVILPDKSEILLNKNSTIEYKKEFNPRTVKLTGEAFFSVSEGETPFVVTTEHGEIEVLGTEFNVKAESEKLEVEVEKGIVEVNTKAGAQKIRKGARAVYNQSRNTLEKGRAEFRFRLWLSELKFEFRKLGKEIKGNGKKAGKEFKKIGKEITKELK